MQPDSSSGSPKPRVPQPSSPGAQPGKPVAAPPTGAKPPIAQPVVQPVAPPIARPAGTAPRSAATPIATPANAATAKAEPRRRLLSTLLAAASVGLLALGALYWQAHSRRAEAETARVTAESAQQAAEAARAESERARAEVEAARTEAEKARELAERHRAALLEAAKVEVPEAEPVPAATIAAANEAAPMTMSEYRTHIRAADAEWERNRAEDALSQLDECPPNLRGWEYDYLRKRFGGEGDLMPSGRFGPMMGNYSRTIGATFGSKPDQIALLTAAGKLSNVEPSSPNRNAVYDLTAEGKPIEATFIERHPFGRGFLVGVRGGLMLVDADYNPRNIRISVQQFGYNTANFSRDGQSIVTTARHNGNISAWSAATGSLVNSITHSGVDPGKVVASPDAKYVAIVRDDGIDIRELDKRSGNSKKIDPPFPEPIHTLLYMPNGKRLAAFGRDLAFIDIATGLVVDTLRLEDSAPAPRDERFAMGAYGFNPPVTCAISPDGRLAAVVDTRGMIHIWDVAAKREKQRIHPAVSPVTKIEFNADGSRLLSVHAQGETKLWNTDRASGDPVFNTELKHLHRVRFCGANDTIVATSSNALVVWKGAKDRFATITPPEENGKSTSFLSQAVSGDGRWIATAARGKIRIFDTNQPGAAPKAIEEEQIQGDQIAMSGDGRKIASAGRDNMVRVWDRETGAIVRTLKFESAFGLKLTFNTDGSRLLTAGKQLQMWDMANGSELWSASMDRQGGAYSAAEFSPDGKSVLAGSSRGRLHVFNATDGKIIVETPEPPMRMVTVPSQPFFVSGPPGMIPGGGVPQIRRSGGPSATGQASGPSAAPTFGPSSGTRTYGQIASAQVMRPVWLSPISQLAVSPDGARVAAVHQDYSVRIWDAKTGLELLNLGRRPNRTVTPSFSADGRRLMCGETEGTILMWDAGPVPRPISRPAPKPSAIPAATK